MKLLIFIPRISISLMKLLVSSWEIRSNFEERLIKYLVSNNEPLEL